MTQAYDIGIAGAGIGGLAAAALLAQAGHRVTVLDQFDAPRPVGSGLVIQPVGLAVLDRIGVGDRARERGSRITRMLGHEAASGLKVLDVTYGLGGDGGHALAIHRASLFNALHAAALAAGASLRVQAQVTGSALRDGRRFLGLNGSGEVGPFDLVIDATGARSPLSPLAGRQLSYGALWGTVPWPAETGLRPDQLAQRYRRASRMAGVLPIGRRPGEEQPLAAIFWSLPAREFDGWRDAPLARWKTEATRLWPEFGAFLETVRRHDEMTFARYSHGTLARPYGPRLAHIGDAAHRASPQLGQGANMALLDAAALSEALFRCAIEDVPAAYAARRRRHIRVYQALSWAFTPQYQSDSRLLPFVRDRVLMPITRIPPFPRLLTRIARGDLVAPLGGRPR